MDVDLEDFDLAAAAGEEEEDDGGKPVNAAAEAAEAPEVSAERCPFLAIFCARAGER